MQSLLALVRADILPSVIDYRINNSPSEIKDYGQKGENSTKDI